MFSIAQMTLIQLIVMLVQNKQQPETVKFKPTTSDVI